MERKNVVLICTDEWPGQLFGHRGRKDVMTPTIDFLADNGVMMENAYSECPVCIPARRSLMTGLTPEHHGDRVYSDRMEMPDCQTLAGAFSSAGYQTVAVGKMHVYPQRDRTGFDDVILMEEGRCEFGVMDDYEIWLGEQGKAGEQFMHGMGNNTYYTRPWHMDEPSHETSWITREAMKQIARRDPKRPLFLYVSFTYPHPPIVPLQVFLDKYRDVQCEPVLDDDWPEEWVIKQFRDIASQYSPKEREDARKAFMAQCTHIDYSIRLIIGSLREHNLLDDTILVFMSDHGDMLFDHKMVAKRLFYEGSASVPLIFSGRPMLEYRNRGYEKKLCQICDVMPTLLDLCDVECDEKLDGISLFSEKKRDYIFGEIGEDAKATRMIRDDRFKLIYYPVGNVFHLFDMQEDRKEQHSLADDPEYADVMKKMKGLLASSLHGEDTSWVQNGEFCGCPVPETESMPNFGLLNQRGIHWPPPETGYSH